MLWFHSFHTKLHKKATSSVDNKNHDCNDVYFCEILKYFTFLKKTVKFNNSATAKLTNSRVVRKNDDEKKTTKIWNVQWNCKIKRSQKIQRTQKLQTNVYNVCSDYWKLNTRNLIKQTNKVSKVSKSK